MGLAVKEGTLQLFGMKYAIHILKPYKHFTEIILVLAMMLNVSYLITRGI